LGNDRGTKDRRRKKKMEKRPHDELATLKAQ
jgi:hypothetical protein